MGIVKNHEKDPSILKNIKITTWLEDDFFGGGPAYF